MPRRPTELPNRLPLPGSRPTGVYEQRDPAGSRLGLWWLRRALGLLLLAGLLAAGVWAWFALRRPVTVVVNGVTVEVRTHRATVAGVLRQAGVRPDDALYVQPALETRPERGAVIVVADLRPVTVWVDGGMREVDTASTRPAEIVEEAGIVLGPNDSLHMTRSAGPSPQALAANPELASVPRIPQEVRVVRARTVIVTEQTFAGDSQVSFTASTLTLGEALVNAGYRLYEADIIEPALSTPLADAPDTVEVRITRATPITLTADGQTRTLRTHAATVGGVLSERGLALTGEDVITPTLDTPLTPGARVELIRVTVESVTIDEPIPFETSYVPRPALEIDTLVEVQPGQTGLLRREITRRMENGRIVSEVEGARWVVRVPESRVLGYGTRIVVRTMQTADGPVEYWRQMRMLATSYSPSTAGDKQPGDPFFGLSGTGDPMQRGIVATDPRVIPLYTPLWVPDYGFAKALDVGGAVKGMRIDLGYDDENLVLWNQWVDVYLVLPIPPVDQIVWVLPDAQVEPGE